MDYNKLMAELDKEVTGSFEPVRPLTGRSATEGYDEVEKDLMDSLEVKKPIVEVDGEEDLVFGEDGVDKEEKSPEEVFSEAVNAYFNSLVNDGVEVEEAVEKVLDQVNSSLPKTDDSDDEEDDIEESEETELVEAEESQKSPETIREDNYTDDPEKQKELFGNTVKELSDKMDMNKATSSATESSCSFEEYQKDKEAKMLKRYKQLANKDLDKKKVAIEGLGEAEISIDDQAISRVSGEYGYSGKNLRKMVAEAIQKGEI